MSWYDNVLPPHVVLREDLESRGVNYEKWCAAASADESLTRLICQCYARHNYGHRRFDEQLHQSGVRLRLNNHCAWLLQEYPELIQDTVSQDTV